MDTYTTLWNRLLSRAPAIGPLLAQQYISDSFRDLTRRRQWTWRRKYGTFYPSILTTTGSVTVTNGLPTVTGSGTSWTPSMVGNQFRSGGNAYPTYTITAVPSSTSLILDAPWTGISGTYNYQIFNVYCTTPSDFQNWVSIVNLSANYRLWTDIQRPIIDRMDPQRAQVGIAYAAAFVDYSTSFVGSIAPCFQVYGSGASPVSTTSYGYTYPSDSIYTVKITASGIVGVSTFQWRQDTNSYSGDITTDSNAIDLSNGVQVYFPAGTYTSGDLFIINCRAGQGSGSPRYEFWPWPLGQTQVYSYLYLAKVQDLTDASPALPPIIAQSGDVLLEMAAVRAARYPGASANGDSPSNPYYDLSLARDLENKSETLIFQLEKDDDDITPQDLIYSSMSYYPAPWNDASWLQSHDMSPAW